MRREVAVVKSAVSAELRAIVLERLGRLAETDADTLLIMDGQSTETLADGISVSLYHETLENGAHKFVVQALKPRWFGLTTAIEVDGFVIEPNGERRTLVEEEMWTYL